MDVHLSISLIYSSNNINEIIELTQLQITNEGTNNCTMVVLGTTHTVTLGRSSLKKNESMDSVQTFPDPPPP